MSINVEIRRMFGLCTATLLLSSVAVAQLPVPRFISEGGATIYLSQTGSTNLNPADLGTVYVSFSFLAVDQDPTTGNWLEPNLVGGYKLVYDSLTELWYQTQGVPFCFGTAGAEMSATILSFDPVSGAGTAELPLPLRVIEPNAGWGCLLTGANTLTAYWGEESDLLAGPFSSPISPWGTKSFSINGVLPSVDVALSSNRGMLVDGTYSGVIVLDATAGVARTFEIVSTAPSVLEVPAQATIAAGEHSVTFTIEARDLGSAKVQISENSAVVAQSEQGVVADRYDLVPWSFTYPADIGYTYTLKFNSKCRPASSIPLVTPGAKRWKCKDECSTDAQGLCEPEITTEDEWSAHKKYSCSWYSFINNCRRRRLNQQVQVQKYLLVSSDIKVCKSWYAEIGFFFGGGVQVPEYKVCCEYEATSVTETRNFPQCF